MKEELEQTFKERIERLYKLSTLSYCPKPILTEAVLLVLKGAFALHPTEMGESFAQWIANVHLSEVAICPHCSKYMPHGQHICEDCLRKEGEELDKIE